MTPLLGFHFNLNTIFDSHFKAVTVCFTSSDFVTNAWTDIERFKEQKNKDLKEALISYAVMQISMCKKVSGLFTFSQIKVDTNMQGQS